MRRLGVLVLLSLAACRRETPMERSAREYRANHATHMASAAVATTRSQSLPDSRLVLLNPGNGLSLGLRVEKTELRVGEPLQVHLVYENQGAEGPISSTTCQGFSLGSEDEETLVSTSVAMRFNCADEDFNRDNNVPLPPNELQTANVSTAGTTLTFDHPGQYLVVAGWQAFRPREGMFLRPDEVGVVASNQVLLTVR